jgi:predicted amidohydrolase YtcJ
VTHLYRGGVIHAPRERHLTSFLVRHGRIAWLGTEAEADSLGLDGGSVTHLEGALVTPGFVDAHVHATSTGLTLLGLDLSCVTSARSLLEAVAEAARAQPGSLLLGHGWDESQWSSDSLPTADELDRASTGARVYLTRVDAHSALVSRALMREIPEVTSMRGFSESGWVTQEAHHALRDLALRNVDDATRERAQTAFLERAAQCGIVCVHEMAGPVISSVEDCTQLLALARARKGVDVQAYWGELAQSGGIDTARRIGAIGTGGDLFVDGSLGSHTACLHEPYRDAPSTVGREFIDVESLIEHVDSCVRAGEQTGFHAIGDAATDAVMSAYSRAAATHGVDTIARLRHRVEHAESLSASSIQQCARLGIIASMQPVFDARWGGDHGMYAQRLGPQRAQDLNAIGALHCAGVTVAFGSDAPVTPLDPWGAIHAAMNHRNPSQRIDLDQSLHAHTRSGWHAARVDGVGRLEVGAPAHLAIWSLADGIPVSGATSLRTLIDGVTSWNSGELEDLPC